MDQTYTKILKDTAGNPIGFVEPHPIQRCDHNPSGGPVLASIPVYVLMIVYIIIL